MASPYSVNAVALAVLPEALGDQPYVERYVRGSAAWPAFESRSRPPGISLLAEPRNFASSALARRMQNLFGRCAPEECSSGTETVIGM